MTHYWGLSVADPLLGQHVADSVLERYQQK